MSSEFLVRLWCEVLFFHVTFRSRLECFYIRLTDNTFCFRHTHTFFMCEALDVCINMTLYIFKRTVIYLCQFTFHLTIIDRKSTRLNSSHVSISYAVFCLKKKKYVVENVVSCNTRGTLVADVPSLR